MRTSELLLQQQKSVNAAIFMTELLWLICLLKIISAEATGSFCFFSEVMTSLNEKIQFWL